MFYTLKIKQDEQQTSVLMLIVIDWQADQEDKPV